MRFPRRSYAGRFAAGKRQLLPIRVAAEALASAVPARDLWVSPAHALHIDDVLVPAGLIVNGATIRQVEKIDRLEYFHVEFDSHDVILTEGAPAETYVDCDNRGMFQNAGAFAELYPQDERAAREFCAPRVEAGSAELTAIRESLFERAAVLGHGLIDDPDLHLIVDAAVIRPDTAGIGVYRFAIPAGSGRVRLASRSAAPAEVAAASCDNRRLGVAVGRIALSDASCRSRSGTATRLCARAPTKTKPRIAGPTGWRICRQPGCARSLAE